MYECQEVSNTALHNFPPTTGVKSKKLEMRTKIKEKSLTPAGELRGQAESRYDQIIVLSPSSSRTLKQGD